MAYVWLTNLNDSVSWTNPVDRANAVVIRNCILDAPAAAALRPRLTCMWMEHFARPLR